MLHQAFVSQPAGGVNYLELFKQALERATFAGFDAAVAYATVRGVLELDRWLEACDSSAWAAMEKRWLVGIDYCRTEPLAIKRLESLPNSKVRIHAGTQVVARKQCTPVLPFHPKVYLLRGPDAIGVICGSGNLSRNGLTQGHEVGNVMLTDSASTAAETLVRNACGELSQWFDATWSRASKVPAVFNEYQHIYESAEHLRSPTPTDDDNGDTGTVATTHLSRHALTPSDLRRLRACKHLWLETGNVTRNRGPSRPGNQLMLTPMTRVYFGFPARDVAPDTAIGYVSITYQDHTRDDCSLVFSNNSMDKLTVPVPGSGGPPSYDNQNLLFTRQPDGTFVLSLGSKTDKSAWKNASIGVDGYRKMTSGRQWGVF